MNSPSSFLTDSPVFGEGHAEHLHEIILDAHVAHCPHEHVLQSHTDGDADKKKTMTKMIISDRGDECLIISVVLVVVVVVITVDT